MMRYSLQPRDRIFVKGYGFLSFVLLFFFFFCLLDHTKQSSTDAFKSASKRAIQKTAEVTGDLIGDKIADVVQR